MTLLPYFFSFNSNFMIFSLEMEKNRFGNISSMGTANFDVRVIGSRFVLSLETSVWVWVGNWDQDFMTKFRGIIFHE